MKPARSDSRDTVPEDAIELFVWDTIERVKRLAELSRCYPDQVRNVARLLSAWPVMAFLRDAENDGSFWHATRVLELGRDYPLDTHSCARIHRGSVMGHYLTHWVVRLYEFKLSVCYRPQKVPNQTKVDDEMIQRCWRGKNEPEPGANVIALLRVALELRPLTKATSDDWSKRVLVPLIMLSDAGCDEKTCRVPVLKTIWRQKGVKSVATFRSRLLSTVRQMLRDRAQRK